jgi:hypothetical protein
LLWILRYIYTVIMMFQNFHWREFESPKFDIIEVIFIKLYKAREILRNVLLNLLVSLNQLFTLQFIFSKVYHLIKHIWGISFNSSFHLIVKKSIIISWIL